MIEHECSYGRPMHKEGVAVGMDNNDHDPMAVDLLEKRDSLEYGDL
jgi:hypothetical protein